MSNIETASEADVLEALHDVVDPELGINVVDLGLVYGVTVDEANIATVDMTLTSAACPLTDVIEDQTRAALTELVDDFRINWVWMPPWSPEKITDDGREMLRALGFDDHQVGNFTEESAAAVVSKGMNASQIDILPGGILRPIGLGDNVLTMPMGKL